MFMRLMAPETERAESSLLISGEQVLMQSKLADTVNLKTSKKQSTRLLLDCGSQRTYISEDLVNNLQLHDAQQNWNPDCLHIWLYKA